MEELKTLDKLIEVINLKISGLNTIYYELKINNYYDAKYTIHLMKIDLPEGLRYKLGAWICKDLDECIKVVTEDLVDILMDGTYKEWSNYNSGVNQDMPKNDY